MTKRTKDEWQAIMDAKAAPPFPTLTSVASTTFPFKPFIISKMPGVLPDHRIKKDS